MPLKLAAVPAANAQNRYAFLGDNAMSLYDEYHAEYVELTKKVGELTAELLNCNPFSQEAHLKPCKEIESTLGGESVLHHLPSEANGPLTSARRLTAFSFRGLY